MYNQFSNRYTNYYLAPGIKFIIIINILIFFVLEISSYRYVCINTFGLTPSSVYNNKTIWQVFTYLFLHGNILHIFFNVLLLLIFGNSLERRLGKNKFLFFYFLCGSGAGLITTLININSNIAVIGASGAIYGVLVAYGFVFPNKRIFLYGVLPIKVKYVIALLVCISFTSSIFVWETTISHITHQAGMFVALLYFLFYKRISIFDFLLKRIYNEE